MTNLSRCLRLWSHLQNIKRLGPTLSVIQRESSYSVPHVGKLYSSLETSDKERDVPGPRKSEQEVKLSRDSSDTDRLSICPTA